MNPISPDTFQLVIIESLRPNDSKTAQKLYHEIIKYKQYQEVNLHSVLHVIKTQKELIQILSKLNEEIIGGGPFPILHLEMHGYEDGIQLTSGEIILWIDLMPFLRNINVTLKHRLLIILGACEGLNLGVRHDINERAGFAIIISCDSQIRESDALAAFEAFYDCYFSEADLAASLNRMNLAIEGNSLFSILPANEFFDRLVNPNSTWIDFEAEKEAKFFQEKYPLVSMEILKIRSRHQILSLLETWQEKKPFFIMSDLQSD